MTAPLRIVFGCICRCGCRVEPIHIIANLHNTNHMTTLKTTRLQVLVAAGRLMALYAMPKDADLLAVSRFLFGLDRQQNSSRNIWLYAFMGQNHHNRPFNRMYVRENRQDGFHTHTYLKNLAMAWQVAFFPIAKPVCLYWCICNVERFWDHLPWHGHGPE